MRLLLQFMVTKNTTVIMMESVLASWSNMCTKRTATQCDECELDEAMVKSFKVSSGWIDRCHGDGGSLRHVSGNKSETAQFLDEVCRSGPTQQRFEFAREAVHLQLFEICFSLWRRCGG